MINNYFQGSAKAVTLVLVLCCYVGVNDGTAQRDMILTQAGEELRCRILDETPIRFAFAYLKDGKPYQSEIFKNLVTSFKFNYYDEDLPNANRLPKAMYRATDGVDPQSPRAIISSTAKANKKSKGRRNKRSNPEDSVNEKMAETATNNNKDTKASITEEGLRSPQLNSASKTQPKAINSPQKISNKVQPVQLDNRTVVNQDNETAKNKQLASDAAQNKARSTSADDEMVVEKVNPVIQNQQKSILTKDKQDGITAALPAENTKEDLSARRVMQENKFRIGLKAGIGNRLDNNLQTVNSYDLYLEQLLRGWTLGGDLAYFPTDALGFGAILTDFRSRNSEDQILYRNEFTGAEQVGSIANNRSVKFVGPAVFMRKKLDYKTYVVLGLSPGYNFYRDRGSYEGVDYTFTGGGFGAASTLGIDFLLGNDIVGRDIILSFEAGYNYGKINALDYSDSRGLVDLTTPLDISRLDFTIGLRFIRFPRYFKSDVY